MIFFIEMPNWLWLLIACGLVMGFAAWLERNNG